MGNVAGTISGIMSGIQTEARIALRTADTSTEYYVEALQRILDRATRAENVWREYMDSL
jgi:hypothetical protein